jgi:hypothetical protein
MGPRKMASRKQVDLLLSPSINGSKQVIGGASQENAFAYPHPSSSLKRIHQKDLIHEMHEVYCLPYQSSTRVTALEQTRDVEASNGHNVSGNLAIALLPPSIPPIHTHVSIPNLARTKRYNEQGQFLVISISDACLPTFFDLFN